MSGEVKRPRKGGDPMTPEGARARSVTSKRGGSVTPEGTKARFTGDAMTNSMKSEFVAPIIVGPTGDSKTMKNPVK